jgi:Secretion system C-terminal sorting domain/PA domain
MKKYTTTIIMLLAALGIAQAQAPKRDTVVLSVYNNNQRFMLYPMPFGKNKPDKEFTAEMVMSYDTVNVLKDAISMDSTGKRAKKWQVERKSGKFTTDVKDKIVLMYYHPNYDVSTQIKAVQDSGALAVVIIHETNSRDSVTLPKKSASVKYADDNKIKIPCFTVRKSSGALLTQMMPSLAGIQRPKEDVTVQPLASNAPRLSIAAQAELAKSRIEWVSSTGDKNDYFIIEKYNFATDKFEKMSVINSNHIAGVEEHFTYDPEPSEGENHYRIQLIQLDGSVLISEIRTVEFSSLLNGITIFPNPVEDEINISMKDYLGKTVDIALFDMQGKNIISQHIESLQTPTITLPLNEKALMGQYMMHIKAKGNREVVKMLTVGR